LLVHLVRYHVAKGLTVAMILPIVALVPVLGRMQVLDLLRLSVPIHRIGSFLDYVDQRLEYPYDTASCFLAYLQLSI
jgi:hypothetical protein